MAVAPARVVAAAAVRRTMQDGAYTDRALRAEADSAGLDSRDRALATQLAYAAVSRRLTLDHLITRFSGRAARKLDPAVLEALWLGLVQLLYLDGIAEHAAVDESVELVKARAPRASGLVNAVLRRAQREGREVIDGLGDATAQEASLKHSVPLWIAEMWWNSLGAQTAGALLATVNDRPERALRANTLVTTAIELASAIPVATRPAGELLPEGLVLEGGFDPHGASELWEAGAMTPQSRAAMLVARLLDPAPGDRILDLCAAPGGKATHLGALAQNGDVLAVEAHPGRARELETAARRLRATRLRVEVGDASVARTDGCFDRVLLDPPCSGLGTLQGRPDRRWRASEAGVDDLVALQSAMLDNAASSLAPGGVLVYSTCTISPRENEQQVAALLARREDLEADDLQIDPRLRAASEPGLWNHPTEQRYLLSMPHRDATDGFFIARLRRRA